MEIKKFINKHKGILGEDNTKYLYQFLKVQNQFLFFYIMAKVHKDPWVPRPIVLQCGSLINGLACWLTQELKLLSKKMPSYLSNFLELKHELEKLELDSNKTYILFTANATTMYTNMTTLHAIKHISWFLKQSPLCTHMKIQPIINALNLVMQNNIFKFGDTYWSQTSGTAMGTSPGYDYATIYYGIYKMTTILWK